MFSILCVVSTLICVGFAAIPEPSEYILSFPKGDNPLNITIASAPEKNYILLIGDWGADNSADFKLQTAVANKMKAFYKNMTSHGYNLLFVATVGDNFYFDGQDCNHYTQSWSDIYGELATDYDWLAVMGNHDWGASDPHAICAWGVPNPFIEPSTGMPYAANQINADKKGCNPPNYYLPDFGYYYTINELNFELIQLDENLLDCGGSDFGHQDYKDCNNSMHIGCGWMAKMKEASENMMIERAKTSKNSNFLISQHYPQEAKRLVDTFKSNRSSTSTPNDRVWGIYGHNHVQRCERKDNVTGLCDCILTGGGGGCCSSSGETMGFYVIGFDENKVMTQPWSIYDPAISCKYPCDQTWTNEEIIKAEFNYCCYTTHGQYCHLYDLTKC